MDDDRYEIDGYMDDAAAGARESACENIAEAIRRRIGTLTDEAALRAFADEVERGIYA